MRKIELWTCKVCGGSYRAYDEGGERYPIYDAPHPCKCPSEDANQAEKAYDIGATADHFEGFVVRAAHGPSGHPTQTAMPRDEVRRELMGFRRLPADD